MTLLGTLSFKVHSDGSIHFKLKDVLGILAGGVKECKYVLSNLIEKYQALRVVFAFSALSFGILFHVLWINRRDRLNPDFA